MPEFEKEQKTEYIIKQQRELAADSGGLAEVLGAVSQMQTVSGTCCLHSCQLDTVMPAKDIVGQFRPQSVG